METSNFKDHLAFNRLYSPNKLTIGIFLPLRIYSGNLNDFAAHISLIQQMDEKGFGAIWVRDIPLFDPHFGDVGQVYDPFTYLSYIAGVTKNIILGTGSIILPFWHPISLAKVSSSIDQLSGNRLVLGVGSGDRAIEFPAFGIPFESRGERFRQVLEEFRQLSQTTFPKIDSSLTSMNGVDLLPKPVTKQIPTLITGASQQPLEWIAKNGDGWMTYPGSTTTKNDTLKLADKITAWRNLIPNKHFKPHMTNEWIELSEDPYFPRTPLNGGFVLKTGRLGLIELLNEWQHAGVNHAALGIQFSKRPLQDVVEELAEEVLPYFPTLLK